MPKPYLFLTLLIDCMYLRGIVGSFWLFTGNFRERRFLRLIAIMFAVGGIAAVFAGRDSLMTLPLIILGIFSTWALRPPQKMEFAKK